MTRKNHQQETKRILVFRIGELGDTLIALPSLRAIREAFPGCHLALLGNVDSQSRHVAPNQTLPAGLIDQWFSYPSGESTLRLSGSIRLLSRLRRARFNLLVYLAPRMRSPADVRRDLLFFRLCGITTTIGHKGFAPLARIIGEPLPLILHEADHLLRRLAQSDVPVPAPGTAVFDLELTDEERSKADSWLLQYVPALGERRIIGFGPGSKWPSKVWPEDRFAELGSRLIRESNIYPIVFGGPDRELADRLIGVWGRGANAAGALTPRQAAAALSRCVMYVGNDTGTMHLAAAVATPCVVAMCAQDWPGHWNPYGEGHIVLRRSVPCEGCFLKVCITEGMRCLKEIEVDEVLAACNQVLSRRPDKEQVSQEMSGVLAS